MKPDGSMMKPDPSEVTWRGWPCLGPRKFLNRSSSGEPGGSWGIAPCGGAFKVWLVEMLTTLGKSMLARSAKLSGAGRAAAGATLSTRARMAHTDFRARIATNQIGNREA